MGNTGTFALPDPHKTSYLYFPLVNEAGMVSVVTPLLHGDSKTDQNTFLLAPVSVEDLHNSRSARSFWVNVEGIGAWSATGNSALQIAQAFADDDTESVTLEAGFLWHKVARESARVGLRAEIANLVPPGDDRVELMRVALTNVSDQPRILTPTAAIPLYGRSADNLRDHRHVTSLLHRIHTHTHGVLVRGMDHGIRRKGLGHLESVLDNVGQVDALCTARTGQAGMDTADRPGAHDRHPVSQADLSSLLGMDARGDRLRDGCVGEVKPFGHSLDRA